MTDASESTEGTKLDVGASGADTGNGAQGSNTEAADPFAGLETGTREWIGTKGYKTVADVAKAAHSAESLIGKSVRVPGPDAKEEDWNQFFAKAGRPETPDGYELSRPESLPEDAFEENAKALKEAAHKAGLTTRQAAAMSDFIFGAAAETIGAQRQQQQEAASAATTELAKAFGGEPGTDAFKGAMHLTTRALTDMGGKEIMEDLKAAGLVSDEGHILNARIATAFWKVGKALYKEDDLHRGEGASAENPFKDGRDAPGMMTKQMELIRKDRPRAERLMREAGRDPKEWFGTPIAA